MMSSILRSSKFVRYFAGLARNIVISNRQDVDGSLLKRSQHLLGVFPSSFSSSQSHLTNPSLEHIVRRLDEDARRTGRISLRELEEVFNEIRHLKKATTSQSLMVIRCCGNLVPEEAPEQRTQLVEEIWKTLEKLGVPLDISHYNALLKVYLENEHKFSPTEFLARLEKQGVEPNRVTYQRLITGYCQNGDIAGATKILEFMKEKQLPVNEAVFNALILGHSQADDMESAEGMISVMKQANLEPSNETYTTLMCGYARRGDKAAFDRLLTDCKLKDVLLYDKDFLEMAYSAALHGHDELVDEILKNIKYIVGYNQDAANILLRLITKGKDESAYKVFLTMQAPVRSDVSINMSGHVIIKQLVKTNRPVETIVAMSDRLEEDGHTKLGLWLAIESSFHHGNVDLTLGLLKAFQQRNQPIRNHYFWPSLVTTSKTGDANGLMTILKRMIMEFDVLPSSDTLKDFYLPYTGSKTTKQNLQTLLEAGVTRRSAVVALLSHLISHNKLKEAVELALQHPVVNMRSVFMVRILVDALQQTGDVTSIVSLIHIMATTYTREEDGEASADLPSRFLSSVASFTQTRGYMADILKEMLKNGLGISNSCAETVESHLPGKQLTTEISDLLAQLSSGNLSPVPLKRTTSTTLPSISRNVVALERMKERLKASNATPEKILGITRNLFLTYCFNKDLENALRVKKEWEEELKQEVTPGWWASLLDLYCSKGNIEEAKQCLEKIRTSSSELELDLTKTLKMAKLYIESNQLDEAMNLIKEVKARGEINYSSKALAWQCLSAAAEVTKDPELVKKIFEVLAERKFIEISNVCLGPIIKAYFLRDDIDGALKEFERCVNLYRATPWKNEIATRLIEKEDAVNLQVLVDLSTQVHGEINSLYDLVLTFVECGRIRQARKILETPGLRSRNDRLHYACERYRDEGNVTPLEGLVEATKDLPHIDRSEIYYALLETYCQADNVDKAYGLWTQMQDEDVHVSHEFLVMLGNFLKTKNLQVPFEIPKTAPTSKDVETKGKPEFEGKPKESTGILSAIRSKDVEKALEIKAELEKKGQQLSQNETRLLLDLLIEENRLREAARLFTSLTEDKFPKNYTLNNLVRKLSQLGEMELLKSVGDHLPEDLKKSTSFINRYMNSAVAAGKAKEELDRLEKEIDEVQTTEEVDAAAERFPRGGIYGVLEFSSTHIEQVARIADKYFNKGVLAPANCLCMFYVSEGEMDKAKEVFQRYNLANSSRIMFKHVLNRAIVTANPKMLEDLLSLLNGVASITPESEAFIHSKLINTYLKAGDVETASLKLDEAVKSIPLENIHHVVLVNLKSELETKNLPFKYTIPPKKVKESSSSSSSSSDAESKQSVVAKH